MNDAFNMVPINKDIVYLNNFEGSDDEKFDDNKSDDEESDMTKKDAMRNIMKSQLIRS
jgi:hypothetical protein